MQSTPQQGIVLFAHGSRDPLWRLPIEAVAQQIKAISPSTDVVCAFLELTSPDLPTCVQKMSEQGLTHISVVPMFLGIGKHAREDLPQIMQELKSSHPNIQFDLRRAIGEEPELTLAMAKIALQSIDQ
jgi:sirohydrochlorin cobaltochelatase